jgi:hypothetical protein
MSSSDSAQAGWAEGYGFAFDVIGGMITGTLARGLRQDVATDYFSPTPNFSFVSAIAVFVVVLKLFGSICVFEYLTGRRQRDKIS